jgi:hypothetical protein
VKHVHQQVNVTQGGQAVVAGDKVTSRTSEQKLIAPRSAFWAAVDGAWPGFARVYEKTLEKAWLKTHGNALVLTLNIAY